jgi:hypothetical protein
MASTDLKANTASLAPAAASGVPPGVPDQPHARLRGRPLLFARILWVAVALINLVSYVSGIPTAYAIAADLDSGTVARLAELGLAPNFPATYLIFLDTATLAIFGFVAFSIFKRRSDEPIALVASAMLFFTAMLYTAPGYEARAPLFMVAAGAALGETLQVAFLLMFPDGRFWPRWSWLLLGPLFLWRGLVWFFDYLPNLYSLQRTGESYPYLPQNPLDLSLLLLVYLFGIAAQIHRYRHASSQVQRQQTKWLVWGVTTTVLIVGGYVLALNTLPIFQSATQDAVLVRLAGRTVRQLALCVIPITLLYSILRYHLWDVDILINRTLVYVPLTSILAGIFAVTMAVTQKIFVSATGQGSEVATIITTLVITSTFAPIKGEIEDFVDRRFKEAPDPYRKLNEFDRQVRAVVDVLDVGHLLRRLLDEAQQAVRSSGGAVLLARDGELRLVYATPGFEGPAVLEIQLTCGDDVVGWLALGGRRSGRAYTEPEQARLQQSADKVARAVALLLVERSTAAANVPTEPCPPTLTLSWPPTPGDAALIRPYPAGGEDHDHA